MAPELTDQALARTAAVIHGCCRVSRPQPAPATVTEAILALAVRRNLKRSIPADTVTAMARGNSIRPASIGVPVLAETAVQRIMIMPATA